MAEEFSVEKAQEIIEGGITQAQELMNDPAKIEELLQQVQEQIKNLPSTFATSLSNIPLMAQMIKAYVTKEYTEVSPKVIATLVAAAVYLVSSKDLVPDNVPVLGIADDIAVVALAMKMNEPELDAFAKWQEAKQLPEA